METIQLPFLCPVFETNDSPPLVIQFLLERKTKNGFLFKRYQFGGGGVTYTIDRISLTYITIGFGWWEEGNREREREREKFRERERERYESGDENIKHRRREENTAISAGKRKNDQNLFGIVYIDPSIKFPPAPPYETSVKTTLGRCVKYQTKLTEPKPFLPIRMNMVEKRRIKITQKVVTRTRF